MADLTVALDSSDALPATPSKSLSSLVSGLCGDSSDESSSKYMEIYHELGLSGDDEEQVHLPQFRRIIAENLDVDASFMYKRVFNAFDTQRNGFLTAKEVVSAVSVLLQGPFQAQLELGMRVYGKAMTPEDKVGSDLQDPSSFKISQMDAILSIVESLQLSSPRARHTLTTDNREKAYHIGEDLVFIIFPKLDVDGDGLISLADFSQACHEDPSLIQVFGQYLPKNTGVLPIPPSSATRPTTPLCTNTTAPETSSKVESVVVGERENIRPRSSSSRSSFEGIDYLRHSPTIGTMWGRQSQEGVLLPKRRSERLEPIPIVQSKN